MDGHQVLLPAHTTPPALGLRGHGAALLLQPASSVLLGDLAGRQELWFPGCPAPLLTFCAGFPARLPAWPPPEAIGEPGISGRTFWFWKKMFKGELARGEQEDEFSACCWLCFVLREDFLGMQAECLALRVLWFRFGACSQVQNSARTVTPQPSSLRGFSHFQGREALQHFCCFILWKKLAVLKPVHNIGGIFVWCAKNTHSF